MSCPWAKIEKPEPISFEEIISEEVARELQAKEEKKLKSQTEIKEHSIIKNETLEDIPSDIIKAPLNDDLISESEEEEIVDIQGRKDWDRFDSLEGEFASIPPRDGKMVTKDDVVMSGRKNGYKLFDIDFSLKMHSKHEQARRHKFHDKKEDQATAEFGVYELDEFTCLLLYKMINSQLLKRVNGLIIVGKEAVILHADSDPSFPFNSNLPKEVVIKIFKTTPFEFIVCDKYIKHDHIFKDGLGTQTPRKTVRICAEKEMTNLMRLQRAGIPCPKVVTLKTHVLVMSFIGVDQIPAPQLIDAVMEEADYIIAYNQVTQGMKMMFNKANLIHANLSEYNILWHEGQCYFIDVSQSVEPSHEKAFHFLYRDCKNISNFFTKKGIPEVLSPEDLFESITGCNFWNRFALLDLQESFKLKQHLVDKSGIELDHNFDTAWEKSQLGVIPAATTVLPDVDLNKVIQEDGTLAESPKA